MAVNPNLLKGTLEPVLLELVASGKSYGYEIARAVREESGDVLHAQDGTLYPALHRLEKRGYLRAKWGSSPVGRRRRYYQLTAKGKRRLEDLRVEWKEFSKAVSRILRAVHVRVAWI